MSYSVNVSVEAPIENQIQEITYDGQEIYQAPLSMSENLARLAQKIDFTKTEDDYMAMGAVTIKKEGESSLDTKPIVDDAKDPNFPASMWPWDSVRTKLRAALTEVCVLADVLAIAKEKRYMVLDPVPQDPVESRPMVQVYGRKKALAAAASTLLAGVERIRANENIRTARNTPDFHIDLLRLRQNWRLKKVSNAIIGDLSYRTAGSKFSQTGVFEVTKAPEDVVACNILANMAGATGPMGLQAPPSALRVTVPPELQGVAFISVRCQKDQEELFSANMSGGVLMGAGVVAEASVSSERADLHWQQKLEAAQNVLFCKELFSRLASEAVQLDASIPHMVIGNQIVATVLPGIQLLIGLCHSNAANNPPNPDSTKETSTAATQKPDHDHVLEHSLHQLLREVHHSNTHHPFPHPASGPLGPSKRRCLAGPMAADRYDLMDMSKQQTLLEQIIQQAQHFFMRRRTEYVLDTIAKEVKDPLIVSHWNALNSPTQSCVKINIMTHGYDAVCRTSLVVHVGEKTLKCICRDGKVRHMSYELQELRDLIFCQIYQHQMIAVQSVGRCMGWNFLSANSHLGSGPVEPLGNASSCILGSPTGDRMISVRCEPSSGIQVAIAHAPRKDFFAVQLVPQRKWENLVGAFKEVRFHKMEGKNFLNKIELLMACLNSST